MEEMSPIKCECECDCVKECAKEIYPGSLVGVSTPEPFGFVTAISAWPLPCGPFIRTNSQRVCGPPPLNSPNVILCANFELILDCYNFWMGNKRKIQENRQREMEREKEKRRKAYCSQMIDWQQEFGVFAFSWFAFLLVHRRLFSVHHTELIPKI